MCLCSSQLQARLGAVQPCVPRRNCEESSTTSAPFSRANRLTPLCFSLDMTGGLPPHRVVGPAVNRCSVPVAIHCGAQGVAFHLSDQSGRLVRRIEALSLL